MANLDVMDRLRAIRRQAQAFPHASADQRLAKIQDLSDLSKPFVSHRRIVSETLPERLAAGRASKSPRVGDKKPEKAAKKTDEAEGEKKRKKKGGRDRKEESGYDRSRVNRSEDVNR